MEERTVGHCEILEGMSEKVCGTRWIDEVVVVIHGCKTSGPFLPYSQKLFGNLPLVCRVVLVNAAVVDSGAVMHDVYGCLFYNSAFSSDGVYCAPDFVQPVHVSASPCPGWWPHLRRAIVVCSFLDNFDSSLRSNFSLFMSYTRRIPSWGISSHLVARLMVAFAES